MKKKLTGRETVMVLFLVVLLIGLGYYMGFYTPLQEELSSISSQCNDVDSQITTAMGKVSQMDKMQAELDEIFARPADEITEIAPYDNKEVVLTQLSGILGRAQSYSLDFTDPKVGSDDTVRRNDNAALADIRHRGRLLGGNKHTDNRRRLRNHAVARAAIPIDIRRKHEDYLPRHGSSRLLEEPCDRFQR